MTKDTTRVYVLGFLRLKFMDIWASARFSESVVLMLPVVDWCSS